MKRLAILLIFITSLCVARAELRVESFEARPMDLSARTHEQLDRNGNVCALVKVELPVEGCKFEGNVLHTHYDVNEYWVYLSAGTKMLNIKCPGERNLMVTFGDVSGIQQLEGGVTYVLGTAGYTLAGGSGQVDPGASYLIIEIEPKSANPTVKIDGSIQEVEGGQVMALLPYGRHAYTVEAAGYGPESGSADVVSGDKTRVAVQLRSTKASLTVDTETPGATITVNGQAKGTGRWSGQLMPGIYSIEASKEGHKPRTVSVTLGENESRELTVPALQAVYGTINVAFRPIDSDVYIDGLQVGTTPYMASDITAGRHSVRVAKDGYDDFTTSVDIAEGQTTNLNGSLTEKKIAAIEAEIERLYESGQYKQCYELAMQNQDNPVAQFYIGDCYKWGKTDLSQSDAEAVKWYRKAAEQWDADAQNDLGRCYEKGQGVPKNTQTAIEWYRKAAKQGHSQAKAALQRLGVSELGETPAPQTQTTAPTAAREPRNLDLCAMLDGKPYYFSESEWKKLSPSAQAKYDKKGIVVADGVQSFLLSLDCTDPVNWQEAVDKYGVGHLPSEAQCRAMVSQSKAINAAIEAFGGYVPNDYSGRYWGKSKDASNAWYAHMFMGVVGDNSKTGGSYRARPTSPLPR